VLFRIREFRAGDFETLWRIDQACFAPGISYSADELNYYIHRRGAFTLVAEAEETPAEVVLEAAVRELAEPAATGSGGLSSRSEAREGPNQQPIPEHILGFLVAEASSKGFGHIITIDVRQHARRFGVGSALMQTTEERLRSLSCSRIYLETAVDNIAALAFYRRRGYELIKTRPRYYSNGVDAFVLRKVLE
jgi:[ribosomal protein S18]-alanine N-acetyltransferase